MESHCIGNARCPCDIIVKDELVTQKFMCGLALPFPTPCYKLAISRMKRDGVEFIMASCIILASAV